MNTLASILHRLTPRTLLLQLAGNAILALLFCICLQVPDSHVWQFILSVIGLAAVAAGFLWLHTVTIQRMRAASPLLPLWIGCFILAGWLLVGAACWHYIAARADDSGPIMQCAGYWNSQLSPHLRTIFTFERLDSWQRDFYAILQWWILPTLLMPLAVESTVRGVRALFTRAFVCIYTYWNLWLATGLCAWLAVWSMHKLMAWHPAHSVHGELISLALRGLAVYVLDVLLFCIALAFICACLARDHARRDTLSQPSSDAA